MIVHTRSDREIEMISKSCQIVADTLEMLSEYVVPGASLIDLDSKAEDYIISRGARPAFKGYMGFPSTLCTSIDDAVVHGIPHEHLFLKEGQIVGIDARRKFVILFIEIGSVQLADQIQGALPLLQRNAIGEI